MSGGPRGLPANAGAARAGEGLRDLVESVRRNALTARETQRLAVAAGEATGRTVVAVTSVLGHMDAIQEATRKVQDIVGIIDTIAFHTNILALNAAVEAARAGEHGRGFAVVAQEVRSLSHRCTEAAREVRKLVGAASGRVTESTATVDQVAESIAEINARVADVQRLMEDLAEAGTRQAAGIEALARGVRE